MNTLNLIRKQIKKAAALHDAQLMHTTYRGVKYDTRCVEMSDPHGTFCYRGKTYTKRSSWASTHFFSWAYIGIASDAQLAVPWEYLSKI